jgi:thiamine biosynthesis lipoprotein
VAEAAVRAVEREMRRIDETLSPYKSGSELSRMNQRASAAPYAVSDELFRLLLQSKKISDLTGGAFDVTFSSVGYLYDYRKGIKPDAATLEQHRPLVNYHALLLDPAKQTVRYAKQGVRVDLGGIAKGYAVDRCIAILRQMGVQHALVTAGGDSYALGDNFGKLWRVGIKHPRQKDKLVTVLPVKDLAVSTSGDYERFFMDDKGERIHHILNPKTGRPVHGVQSVTILATNSTLADALSTSVFVLGVQRGMQLVESLPGVSVIVVDDQGQVHYSSDLASRD